MDKSITHQLRFIFWETTAGCNLECIHCRRLQVSRSAALEDLNTQEALDFIESISRDLDPAPVLIFSGGEPLIRRDFFELARFAKKAGMQTALATNGTLIERSLAKEIVESGIRRVSISLDGAGPSTHNELRNMPGSFEKAVEGFRLLQSLGMSLQLNTTLTRRNLHELNDIYRLSLQLGADSLHYFLLVPVGCGLQIKEEFQLSPEEYERALLRIHEQALERKIHIRPICAPHYFRIMIQNKSPLLVQNENHNDLNQITRGCLAGTGICFVSHKGDVFPCGYLPLSAGNVRRQRLAEIWHQADIFEKLRHSDGLVGKCGVCEFSKSCFGCRARAYEETGNYLAEEPNCSYIPASRIS